MTDQERNKTPEELDENGEQISSMENHYTKEQLAQMKRKRRQTIFRRRRLLVVGVFVGAVFCITAVKLFMDYRELVELRKEKVEAKKEYAAVAEKKQILKRNVARLNDEEYVGKLARSEYFLSKDGETIYRFPLNSGAIGQTNEETEEQEETTQPASQ